MDDILAVGHRPKVGFDEFLEALSTMAKGEVLKSEQDYLCENQWLYVHLNSCVPKFKKWARETQFDGEVLGRTEYLNQAKELFKMNEYIKTYSRVKRFSAQQIARCVLINLRQAERLGLDINGFGFTAHEEDYSPPDEPDLPFDAPPSADLPPEMTEEPKDDSIF